VEFCAKCFPDRKTSETVPALFLILLVCSSLLLVSTSYVNVKTIEPAARHLPAPPSDLQAAAYDAARMFVNQRYPGERLFAPLGHSPLEQSGNLFVVMLSANEQAPGTQLAVRNVYRVEMEYAAGEWKLAGIGQ
jgi:hypothetical protein